jgi:hypothetical protein
VKREFTTRPCPRPCLIAITVGLLPCHPFVAIGFCVNAMFVRPCVDHALNPMLMCTCLETGAGIHGSLNVHIAGGQGRESAPTVAHLVAGTTESATQTPQPFLDKSGHSCHYFGLVSIAAHLYSEGELTIHLNTEPAAASVERVSLETLTPCLDEGDIPYHLSKFLRSRIINAPFPYKNAHWKRGKHLKMQIVKKSQVVSSTFLCFPSACTAPNRPCSAPFMHHGYW